MNSWPAAVFHAQIQLMTDTLDRAEMIYREGRNSPGYKRFKRETMFEHYTAIDLFWELLQANGLVEACDCGADAKRYTDCPDCGGSGCKAKEELSGLTENA